MTRLLMALLLLCFWARGSGAEETGKDAENRGLSSLTRSEPGLLHTAMRYPRFYGDGDTLRGGPFERSNVLGSLGGVRDSMIDYGIYANVGVTQFFDGNLSGGLDTTNSRRLNGSADYWLWVDSGQAGLWSNGVVFLHGETSWQATESLNADVGSLLPANTDATHPDPSESNTALSEVYLMQALPSGPLPGNFLAAVGKQNLSDFADTNSFANNERTQFQYSGLVNNPIVGSFVPYTGHAAWLSWSIDKEHTLIGIFSKAEGQATDDNFDALLDDDNTYAMQYNYTPTFDLLPGRYTGIFIYSTKDIMNFEISDRQFVGETLGLIPEDTRDENYTFLFNFEQYLWVEEESGKAAALRHGSSDHPSVHRHHNNPLGLGLFGRAGWAPKDRNVIDQHYSLGIGGYGMLIPGRDEDSWGIGWSGTHTSGDLRDLDSTLRTFEHSGEVFYNFELTPAAHLTVNSQVIRPADEAADTAFTLGARLQVDF